MAQITIYLPAVLEKKARKAAKADGLSMSRWIAGKVTHSLDDAWSKGVLDAAGAIPDFPELDELRRGYSRDLPREKLK